MSTRHAITVAITGISGTVAKYLTPYLASRGTKIIGIARRDFHCPHVEKVFVGDLSNESFLTSCLSEVDYILHLSALTRSANTEKLSLSNESVTATLIKAAEKANIKKFIMASSDLAATPVGPYGLSKQRCEQLVSSSKLSDWTILRISSLWANTGINENSTIASLLNKVAQGQALYLPNGGNFFVSPIPYEDLQCQIWETISGTQNKRQQLLEIEGETFLLINLLRQASKKLNMKLKVHNVPLSILNISAHLLQTLGMRHHMFETIYALSTRDAVCPLDENCGLPAPTELLLNKRLEVFQCAE